MISYSVAHFPEKTPFLGEPRKLGVLFDMWLDFQQNDMLQIVAEDRRVLHTLFSIG